MTVRLPATLDDLRGRRAARWIRESTKGQSDRFGPETQRRRQDEAIAAYGLVDSGIEWAIAHSGWRKDRRGETALETTPAWADMLARAGVEYDVLVVGYVSRFAREARTAFNARHELHRRGAALLFAGERILSSDEAAWDNWAREAVEAESYSRRLSAWIREAFEVKHRDEHDVGSGETSYGFRRVGGFLEPDPVTMPRAIEAYRRSAAGETDAEVAAGLGLSLWTVRTILRSPLYGGRLPDGRDARFPAPVPLELREAAAATRARRSRSGHAPKHRVYPLTDRGPLVCDACDRPLIGAYRVPAGRRMHRHPGPCEAWERAEVRAERHELQVAQLLAGAKPNRESAARIRRTLARPVATVDRLAIARLEAEMRRTALALVAAPDRAAVDRLEALRAQRDVLAATPIADDQPDADEALDYLADLGRLWGETSDAGRRALAVATFARLGAVGERIVSVDATPHAERRGLVLALPLSVTMVGGTGVGPVVTTRWPIRIAGRSAWKRAARSA